MYSPFSLQDLEVLEEMIKQQKSPLLMETPFGKVALVITEPAKLKYTEKGYIAITLSELKDWLLDIPDYKKQKTAIQQKLKQLKEQQKLILSTLERFDGKLLSLKRG